MPLVAEQLSWDPILPVLLTFVLASFAVGMLAIARWKQRRPIVPYQPRRPVPWQAFDLAVIVVFYLVMQSGAIELARMAVGPDAGQLPAMFDSGQTTVDHMIGRLVSEGSGWALLLCVVSAAIVAPLAEEFFFRVLLQGWLESLEHRWRRLVPTLRQRIPRGLGPILLTSLLFARMHFRVESPQINFRFLIFLLAGDSVARLLTLVAAVAWLHRRVGATAVDLGWERPKLWADIQLGFVSFLGVAAPIYALQISLRAMLPAYMAPDPLPLFFFAFVLGTLYFRTHRIVPLIVLHAALNGTSLLLAWLGTG
jgi:membrane protease YdiL (CAAX protease family)